MLPLLIYFSVIFTKCMEVLESGYSWWLPVDLVSTQPVSAPWLTVPPGTTCHSGLGGSCRFTNGPDRLAHLHLLYLIMVGCIFFL